MSDTVRTTITLPTDLYDRLRTTAFYQKKTISALVRDGVSQIISYKNLPPGSGIRKAMGKFQVKGERGRFERREFYDGLIRKEMSS